MFKNNLKNLTATASLVIGLSLSHVALAGGMPNGYENVSALDAALMEIHKKNIDIPINTIDEPKNAPIQLSHKELEKETVLSIPELDLQTQDTVSIIEEKKPTATVAQHKTATVPSNRIVNVQPESSFFGLSVGLYDPFTHDKFAAAFNLEYQAGVRIAGVLQPIFGAMITTEASFYGYTGVGVPIDLTEKIMIMPSIAIGIYENGRGVDLGSDVAYRFGTEIAWKLKNNSRIGLNAHILSNGTSFGRDDRTEIISLVYTTPFNGLNGTDSSLQK